MNNTSKKQNYFKKKEKGEKGVSKDPIEMAGDFANFEISPITIDTLKKHNFNYLFPIQQKTYKHIYEGKDIIGRDRTGSGKTLAFALPTLERLRKAKKLVSRRGQRPLVLVVVPTRELAIQVTREFEKLRNKNNELRVLSVYGGTDIQTQIMKLRSGVEVVVGTPGRIMDLQERGEVVLSDIECMVLDETDQMLNFGFQEDIEDIIDNAKQDLRDANRNLSDVQFLLFSATVPRWVEKIAMRFMKPDLERVDMVKGSTVKTSMTVEHLCIVFPSREQKIAAIGDVVKKYGGCHSRTIIFTDTKEEANNILLNGQLKMDLQVLHGDIPQNQREVTFKSFRNGKLKCLVATNVAARGLDIPEVDLIIQLSPPKDIDAYIHRSGRTGRAGKSGVCITFYTSWQRELIGKIEYKIGVGLKKVGVPQPEDIIKASARDISQSFDNVSPDVLEFFTESANDILEHYTPEEALKRALAIMSGYTKKLKQRSMLSSSEGYVTYVVQSEREIRTFNYIRNNLKKSFSSDIVDTMKGMCFLKDRYGVVFDLPVKHKEMFDELIENMDDRYLEVYMAKELPEIEEKNHHQNNSSSNKLSRFNNSNGDFKGRWGDRNNSGKGMYNRNKNNGYESNNGGNNYSKPYQSNGGGRGRGGFGFGGNNKMISEVDHKKLFVTNLGNNSDKDLRKIIEEGGYRSTNIFIVKNSEGKSKGIGYVSFGDTGTAQEVLEYLDGYTLNSKQLRVNFAMKK